MDPRSPEPPPPPPPPRPFAGEPRRAPAGCGRPLLIGCGALAALVGIAAIVFVVKSQDLLSWMMRKVEAQVIEALPADVTAEERARLEHGFDAAIANIRAGKVEVPALKALQLQLTRAAEKAPGRQLTRDDVLDLLSAVERVGGVLAEEETTPAATEPSGAESTGDAVPAPAP